MDEPAKGWDGAAVRRWLDGRITAARADQVAADRHGRGRQDDCDQAAAEELVCTAMRSEQATASQNGFIQELTALQQRDVHVWRGVYDDDRFDRHVRSYARRLVKMARSGSGFDNVRHYQ